MLPYGSEMIALAMCMASPHSRFQDVSFMRRAGMSATSALLPGRDEVFTDSSMRALRVLCMILAAGVSWRIDKTDGREVFKFPRV